MVESQNLQDIHYLIKRKYPDNFDFTCFVENQERNLMGYSGTSGEVSWYFRSFIYVSVNNFLFLKQQEDSYEIEMPKNLIFSTAYWKSQSKILQ